MKKRVILIISSLLFLLSFLLFLQEQVPSLTGNAISNSVSKTVYLSITSSPDRANVTIDGKQIKGTTPLTNVPVATGKRIFIFSRDDCYPNISVIDINQDTKTVNARLNYLPPAFIYATSNPKGTVFSIDGFSPLELADYLIGIKSLQSNKQVKLRFRKDGYRDYEKTVTLQPYSILAIHVDMKTSKELPSGYVSITSSPAGAAVSVDGTYIGDTSASKVLTARVTPGKSTTIKLAKQDYQDYVTTVHVPAAISGYNPISVAANMVKSNQPTGQQSVNNYEKNRQTGSLEVRSSISGLKVSVRYMNKQNPNQYSGQVVNGVYSLPNIPTGSYLVVLSKNGIFPSIKATTVTSGRTTTIKR